MSKLVKTQVVKQGAPAVSYALVHLTGSEIVTIAMQLSSKYCKLDGVCQSEEGVPGIIIGATEKSIRISNIPKDKSFTIIEFLEYVGWTVWSCNIISCTVQLSLVKEKM